MTLLQWGYSSLIGFSTPRPMLFCYFLFYIMYIFMKKYIFGYQRYYLLDMLFLYTYLNEFILVNVISNTNIYLSINIYLNWYGCIIICRNKREVHFNASVNTLVTKYVLHTLTCANHIYHIFHYEIYEHR